MIKKIIKTYREIGFVRLVLAVIISSTRRFFGLNISVHPAIEGGSLAKKLFKGRNIKNSGFGYYYVDPMPTKIELNSYYEQVYWGSRSGKDYSAYGRDFRHFLILQNFLKNTINFNKLSFLNFGSGHGGISYLMHMQGANILNIEPSGMPNSFEKRWNWSSDIESIKTDSIDLLYASHSIEHVHNIEDFIKQAKRILKINGYIFIEVPNARCEGDRINIMRNKIDIPHTYYFNIEYFEKVLFNIKLNKAYNQPFYSGDFEKWESFERTDGAVIMALGQIRR